MLISKRKYYRNFYLMMMVAGLLIFISGSVANQYLLHINMIDKICRYAIIMEAVIVGIVMVVTLLKYKDIACKRYQRYFIHVMNMKSVPV